jgi:hypothetical protein
MMSKGATPLKPFGLALLFVIFAVPAHAQRGAGSSSSRPTDTGGGGGGGGDYGSVGISGSHIPVTQFTVVSAHGEAFVPSSYMTYDHAVAVGQAVLDTKQKTLGEVAREYREAKERKQ